MLIDSAGKAGAGAKAATVRATDPVVIVSAPKVETGAKAATVRA